MLVEVELGDGPWPELPGRAVAAEEIGYDGLAAAELTRDPFVTATVAATATQRIRIATSVAIAFPRSPMVVAYTARNLQDLSKGRFVLGLGTQVKGHIERRFGVPWDSPGPRLREYIEVLRATWDTWQHETPLRYEGRFYRHTLMTPAFSPPPSDYPAPQVQIAAVNAYNIRLAGELCDGIRVHPFSTPRYTREVIWPELRAGAAKSGHALDGFEVNGTGFIATGPDEEAVTKAREEIRQRLAFYASTRTYLPVLELHGWGDLNPQLTALIAENRWDQLGTIVPDSVLDEFCIAATWDDLVPAVRERLGGLVDCIGLAMPAAPDDRFRATLDGLRALPGSAGGPPIA